MLLNATQVERLIRDGKNSETVAAGGGRGEGRLLLVVRNMGERVSAEWRIQYFMAGQRRRMKVGNAGKNGLSLKDARERFTELSKFIQDGQDPKAVEEERKREEERQKIEEAEKGSVGQLFEAYIEHLRQKGRRSWREVQRALLTAPYAAVVMLGKKRKARDIAPRDIQRLLSQTHDRGASMAAHMRAYLHGAFAFGIGREFDYTRSSLGITFSLETNPVASVPRDTSAFRAGNRNLSKEEVKRLWTEFPLSGVEESTAIAVKLILSVGGQRVEEVLGAKKAEFNPVKSVWVLPAGRTKNGREHIVPLSPRAVALYRQAEALSDGSEYLFPNSKDPARPMPSASLNRAVCRFCKGDKRKKNPVPGTIMRMKPWTPRDLRRTCRTLMADAGEPSYLLNLHFNHGQQGVGEKHYDRSSHLDEKRALMARWDKVLAECLGEESGGKVLEFPGRQAAAGDTDD